MCCDSKPLGKGGGLSEPDLTDLHQETEKLCAILSLAIEILGAQPAEIEEASRKGLLDGKAIKQLRNLHLSLGVAAGFAELAADRIEANLVPTPEGRLH